jgi:UDP-glucose 4-epimerase
MRILVTGGAGFIASHVVDTYLAAGHDVAVLDNLSTGSLANLHPRARFYEADICDAGAVTSIFARERPDVVNHHAAQMDVRRSTRDPVYDATCNILGSLNLLLACVRHSVHKVIYISTGGAVYGEPEHIPVPEEHPIRPISPYGVSKHTVEHYLHLYALQQGPCYTTLRYPNVFGPRQSPHGEAGVVAIFAGQLLAGARPCVFGDGAKTRDYVYIDDIARANLLALDRGDNGIFNLGSGLETSDRQVFDAVRAAVGAELEPLFEAPRVGEIQRIALNASRARTVLDWQPRVPFEEGVRRTVAYHRGQLERGLQRAHQGYSPGRAHG